MDPPFQGYGLSTGLYQTKYRLNMVLEFEGLFGLHVYSCTHRLRPRNSSPPPAFGLIYEGAIVQPR